MWMKPLKMRPLNGFMSTTWTIFGLPLLCGIMFVKSKMVGDDFGSIKLLEVGPVFKNVRFVVIPNNWVQEW
jgi:hypothetical protein